MGNATLSVSLGKVQNLLEDAKGRCKTVTEYDLNVQAMHREAQWASERIDKALEILATMAHDL